VSHLGSLVDFWKAGKNWPVHAQCLKEWLESLVTSLAWMRAGYHVLTVAFVPLTVLYAVALVRALS
jgi:hypothetical protein